MAKKKRGGKGRFKSKRALSAQIGLSSLINKANKNPSFRNDPASEQSVIKDMPEKFQDNFKGVKSFEDMNEAQKAIFNFYNDGRSEFQRQLNRNIQSNPFFAEAYKERFPITAGIMSAAPTAFKAIGSMIAPGFGLAASAIEQASGKVSNVGTSLRESLEPTFSGIKELFTPDLGRGPGPLTRDQNTANMDAMNQAALNVGNFEPDIFTPRVETDVAMTSNLSPVANPNLQRIFAFPRGTGARLSPEGTVGNYLVSDPGGLLRMANMPVSTTRGFAEGGIASLQDPNYNLLMEASDFSL